MKLTIWDGYNFTVGAALFLSVCSIVAESIVWFEDHIWDVNKPIQTDSTDLDQKHLSGLRLYTDHLTGCQYVSVKGSMTPRLATNGQPLCKGAI